MATQLTNEELDAAARIAEARILKVVVSWLFGIATLMIAALSFAGWQTVSTSVDKLVDGVVMESLSSRLDSVILGALVTANVDSLIDAQVALQVAQARVDSLARRQVEEAEAKLIVPREAGQERRVLTLDEPMRVAVHNSSDSTVVLEIRVPESAEYEITAVARDDSTFDPIIAVMTLDEDQELLLVDLDDDSGDGLNSLLRVRLEQEPNYQLWVAGFLSAEPDTVTISLREVDTDA